MSSSAILCLPRIQLPWLRNQAQLNQATVFKRRSVGKPCGMITMHFDQTYGSSRAHMMSTGSKLEAALVANAVKLSKNAAAGLPATWNLVQVEFAATNFSTLSAATAPSIHRFLHQCSSLPAQPAQPLTGVEPNQALLTDIRKSAILQVEPDKVYPQHSTGNMCSASTSATAVAHQVSAGAGNDTERSESADCLLEPVAFADVDVEQQRQMLRAFEVSKALSTRQLGSKRTHTGRDTKQAVKLSKLVHDTGQRTITSLFRQG